MGERVFGRNKERSDDPRGLLGRQLRGPGAMIAVRLRGGYDAAAAVTAGVRLFTHAVSLGGVDSLIQHPAALTHRPVPADARPGADIVRLSIGLEDAGDLMADLDAALAAADRGSGDAIAGNRAGVSGVGAP